MENDQSGEVVRHYYKQYRKSGLALMSTVITLATGGLIKGDAIFKIGGWSAIFGGPILLALAQEYCHFRGSQLEARCAFEVLLKNTAAASTLHKRAQKWLGPADTLVACAIVSLVLCGVGSLFLQWLFPCAQ